MNTSGASQKWTAVPGTELNDHLDIGTKATHEIKRDNFDLGREAFDERRTTDPLVFPPPCQAQGNCYGIPCCLSRPCLPNFAGAHFLASTTQT